MDKFMKALDFDSDTLGNVKRDMNFVLQRLIGNMMEKGSTNRFEAFLTERRYDHDGKVARYDSERKLTAANLLTGQYLEKELGAKVERLIANAKKEVEESLISSLEQKLKENLAKDTIEKMNIPEVLKRFTEMSLEQKQ